MHGRNSSPARLPLLRTALTESNGSRRGVLLLVPVASGHLKMKSTSKLLLTLNLNFRHWHPGPCQWALSVCDWQPGDLYHK
jgi:hypothetical protein